MRTLNMWTSTFVAALTLAACGGSDTAPVAATTTTITGNAVKGPVTGATVTIKNAATGAVLVTTTTEKDTGFYSVPTTFNGDVLIEVSGGSYTDESSGQVVSLAAPLRTVLTASGGTVTGMVTPLTTMAYAYSGSTAPTAAVFNTSAAKIATGLGLGTTDILTTLPNVTTATPNDYGRSLRALSQYLADNPGVKLADLVSTAMASTTFPSFSASYGTSYNTINGRPITVSFNGGNVITVGGTGSGTGGTGRCGLAISLSGANVANICYEGVFTAADCSSSNAELAASAAEQQALIPGSSFVFTPACVANPTFTIKLN